MSNNQPQRGVFDFESRRLPSAHFTRNAYLHEGMRQFPIALASSDGFLALPPGTNPSRLQTRRLLMRRSNPSRPRSKRSVCSRTATTLFVTVLKRLSKSSAIIFKPRTRVYCVKSELAKAIGEYENGQLKTFTQEEAVERIGHGVWQEPHLSLNSAAWVLQAFLWCVENGWTKTNP